MPVVEGVVWFFEGGGFGTSLSRGDPPAGGRRESVCEILGKYRYSRDHLGGSSVRQKGRGECAAAVGPAGKVRSSAAGHVTVILFRFNWSSYCYCVFSRLLFCRGGVCCVAARMDP